MNLAQSLKLHEDEWQSRATAAAIEAAKSVLTDGAVNPRAIVGSLSTTEWGWVVSAAIFGWINTKAKQAVAEGTPYDITIRNTCGDPSAWDAGAVGAVLPALGDIPGLDWGKPIGAWTKPQIIAFAWHAHKLVDAALAARVEGEKDVITKLADEEARIMNAAAGGPLMSPDDLEDEVPF